MISSPISSPATVFGIPRLGRGDRVSERSASERSRLELRRFLRFHPQRLSALVYVPAQTAVRCKPSRDIRRLRSSAILRLSSLLVLITLAGCASALPGLEGAGTTPARKGDLMVGGASRLVFGSRDGISRQDAVAPGINPVAAGRVGLRRGLDLGVMASGTDGALTLRAERPLLPESTTRKLVLYGVRVYGGGVAAREAGDDRGYRLGVEIPVHYAIDIGGLYEGNVGLRASAEYLNVHAHQIEPQLEKEGLLLRIGPSIGFGLGLRRFYGLFEIQIGLEGRTGSVGREDGSVGGYILPAFALRVRP